MPAPKSLITFATTRTILIVIAVLLCMLHVWEDLLTIAWRDSESSHILLVPVVFIYLVWTRRKRFADLNGGGNVAGVFLIILSAFLHNYSLSHQMVFGWHLSAVICLLGGIVLAWGIGFVSRFTPAVFALFLMVPIPGLIRQQLSTPIQLVCASIAAKTLTPLGLDVTQSGCLLKVNGTVVAIAEACNGMRMLFGVMLVVYAIAFALPISSRRRFAILLFSPVAAIALNLFRLLGTVAMFGLFEESVAQAFHDINGWLIPLAIMTAAILWLERSKSEIAGQTPSLEFRSLNAVEHPIATGLGVAVLLLNTVLHGNERSSDDVINQHRATVVQQVNAIPFAIGDWIGSEKPLHLQEQELLNPIASYRRTYRKLSESPGIDLVIVASSNARNLVGHEPGICFVRQGWKLVSKQDLHWHCAGLEINGTNYRFQFESNKNQYKQVASVLVTPGRPTSGDPATVASAASDYRRSAFGAAGIQLLYDRAVPDDEWEAITSEFIICTAPLIRQFQNCLVGK